jgi:MscS family membrane protein
MKFKTLIIRFAAIWLTFVLVAGSAGAQQTSPAEPTPARPKDEYSPGEHIAGNPLEPADTSSPRDTLHSYLTNMRFMLRETERMGWAVRGRAAWRAYHRATSTLDFSTTPDSNSYVIMTQRILMLLEILDRIELPPEDEIPGDEEVVDGAVNQWTLPGSSITIQRIESGPRAGEFLFSAGTVQRLHRYFRKAKQLPYKAGAIAPGAFEASVQSEDSFISLEMQARNRLKPVDTSNPRSTLDGFLDSVNRAFTLVMDANAALEASPPTLTDDEAREIEIMARNLMLRAVAALDLSQVPDAIRYDVGIESVLQLKEIFDRMLLPPIESVPDAEMVTAERERLGRAASENARPVRWRYPSTNIEIVEIVEGEEQGQFLFDADTVSRLTEFYEKVRDLPYRRDYTDILFEYISPGTSKGFYDYYVSTPGYLIHQATFWGRFIESLPNWAKTQHGGQTVWQWISLVLFVSLGASLLVMFHGRLLRRPVELSPANRHWRRIFFNLVALVTLYSVLWLLNDIINLTGSVLNMVRISLTAISWIFLAMVALSLCRTIAETIIASPRIDPEALQASYIRAIFGVLGFVVGASIFVYGLSYVGVSLIPLLTGVGIGGLAIALAARPTLENIIGSFMLFLDKPVQVGQRVNVMGQDGMVEAIGLRSTKIRLLTGHLTAIPNEKMAAVEIENIGRRPHIRRLFNVTITYDTPPEKINRAVDILTEILAVPKTHDEAQREPHPNESINQPDFPPRVSFNDLNADSLNIIVVYWYHPANYWDYLEHAHWINIQIMERFNTEGIDFAFPTQTLHVAGDDKRPLTVGHRMP